MKQIHEANISLLVVIGIYIWNMEYIVIIGFSFFNMEERPSQSNLGIVNTKKLELLIIAPYKH